MLKKTKLLHDLPSTEDEFGPHARIATLIHDEIIAAEEGRTIAVVGDWGSGKSTIIKILEEKLSKAHEASGVDVKAFNYDAWSHQGDPLRRSFLDDLITFLKSCKLLTQKEADEASEKLWHRSETTKTVSEPVLRRHATLLILAALLIPLGSALFSRPTDPKSGFLTLLQENKLSLALMLSPLWLAGLLKVIQFFGPHCLKQFIFGDTYQSENFAITSFLLEKIQAKVERRVIRTPADSIVEFKNLFNEILNYAHQKKPKLRVVIIVDNIDRLPQEEARQFWSTMQTFFGDGGGLQKTRAIGYWLVAPFSLQALSLVFGNSPTTDLAGENKDEDRINLAKLYVDKVFGTTFNVPPPIVANWRRYLLKKLGDSFPEHDLNDRIAVRDLYDLATAAPGKAMNPRRLKLFVNDLVILYRERGDEIALPVMAAFLLHKNAISGSGLGINSSLLRAEEVRVIGVAAWQPLFAGLYFGVSPEEGAQLLVEEPIIAALRAESSEQLRQLERRAGFYDVLPRCVRNETARFKATDGDKLARLAAMISKLDGAAAPALSGLWRELAEQLGEVSNWTGFDRPLTDGLKAIIAHASEPERLRVISATANALSHAALPKPEGVSTNLPVANWLNAAIMLIGEADTLPNITVSPPPTPAINFELLQQLTELKIPTTTKQLLKFTASNEEISTTISEGIKEGRYPRNSIALVEFASKVLGLEIAWPKIGEVAAARLRATTDIGSTEYLSLTTMLIASNTLAHSEPVLPILKSLSADGTLENYLFNHQADLKCKGATVIAIILSNPNYERTAQMGNSPSGDGIWNQIINAQTVDPNLLQELQACAAIADAGAEIFRAGAQSKTFPRLAAALVGALMKSNYKFHIEPKFLIDSTDYLQNVADLISANVLVGSIAKAHELLSLLIQEGFQIDRSRFYSWTLDTAFSLHDEEFFGFLERGIENIKEGDWEKSLNSQSGPSFDLVELCGRLRETGRPIELQFPARDALLAQIRKILRGQLASSPLIKERMNAVFVLVRRQQQTSLITEVIEDLISSAESTTIRRAIDLFGEHISTEPLLHADHERIVQRIFRPILSEPDLATMEWMLNAAKNAPSYLQDVPEETRDEFANRLSAAAKNTALSEGLRAGLTQIANVFQVDLAEPKEDEDS